ncbi:MAG: amino acid ABC transporter substrate-binding protein [Flavobacteriales bacterium]|nr:amino acid ABC transporter substrate-binding protein [Flavobacteriales bacterium]
MNGNKYIALLIYLILSSCSILRSDPVQSIPENPEKVEKPVLQPGIPGEELPDPAPEKKPEIVYFHGNRYEVAPHKGHFNVALILPFYEDAADLNATSEIMFEYYQGVRIALESLEQQGLKLDLHVFDNRNDTNRTHTILDRPEFKKMDLIVGPILEEHLRIVSDYGLKHKVPVFSPFSTVNRLHHPNPHFYSSIPGYKLKAARMVQFWEKHYPNAEVVLFRDGGRYDMDFVPHLLDALQRSGKLSYRELKEKKGMDWAVELKRGKTSVIYIPSQSKQTVSSTLGKIFATRYDVVLFGEQGWLQFENNDFNFWSKMNVHIIATEYLDPSDSSTFAFRRAFRAQFVKDPGMFSYMGYDQFSLIGEMFMAFGEYFPSYVDQAKFKYLTTSYQFTEQAGFRQNQNLYFLRFEEDHLNDVTD